MPRLVRIPLIAAAAVLGLLLLLLAVVAAIFDPNDHKALLIAQVQARYQRTLAIPGRIELSLFPSLGARLGAVSLSEPRSKEGFASLRAARVSLALWPLLRRQLVVDSIEVDGLQAQLTRFKDGRTSIDDLLGASGGPPAPAAPAASGTGTALQFDIAGIAFDDAAISIDDQQAGRRLVVSQAQFRSGRIRPAEPAEASLRGRLVVDNPALDTTLSLQGRFSADPAQGSYAAQKLELEVTGRVAALAAVKLGLSVPALTGSAQGLKIPALALALNAGGRALKADGSASIDLVKHSLDSSFNGQFDQSRFQARIGLARFTPAAVRFDLEIDQIDLDRYLAAAPTAAGAASAAAPAPEQPLDLSALRGLDASGSLRVGALQVAHLKTRQLRVDLRAAGGRLDLNPLSAELYEGRVAGSLALVAATVPQLSARQTFSDISIGPLLHDTTGKATLEGRGNVVLDLSSRGATAGALKKVLAGSAQLELRDGMVRGFNIAQSLRNAKARLGMGPQQGTATASEATDFSAMTASFRIADGVAHNDDLQLHSPLLRVGGSGDVDLGNDRLDYLVKATVVATLEGQGGPELQALRGQTVPVRLSGPFSAIGYQIDVAGIAKDLAKQKLEGKADGAVEKAKQRLGDKLKGLLGR